MILSPDFSKFTIVLPLLAVFAASSCSTLDGDTSSVATAKIAFPSIKNPWAKTNPKYAELGKGPLSGDIGEKLSEAAKQMALDAEYNALESRKSGEHVTWQLSANQNGRVTTFPPYQVGTSKCRRYIHSVSVNGQSSQSAATACRDQSGKWTPLT